MRIAFDIRPLARRSWTGIERYTFHLASNLAQALSETDCLQLFAFSYGQRKRLDNLVSNRFPSGASQTKTTLIPLPVQVLRSLLRRRRLPGEILLGRPDLIHTVDEPWIDFKLAPIVATVFDLTPRIFPEHFSTRDLDKCNGYFELVQSRARRVITLSESAKLDIQKHLGIPSNRISVTPLAADTRYRPIDDEPTIQLTRNAYGAPKNYLVYVGTLGPRKNLATLIRSYAQLPSHIRRRTGMLLCGRETRYSRELRDLCITLQVADSVHFTGYLPFKDLHHLLCGAKALVYPTLYEGFGLPILEAMACGVPVISSNVASIPEVAGDAARLVPPEDAEALSRAIEEILEDPQLRLEMRARGFERSAAFTWRETARTTVAAYRLALMTGDELT